MSDKPKPGAEVWTWDGIEPARAHWIDAEAYRKAINDIVNDEIDDPEVQVKLFHLINAQGSSLLGLRDALHVIDTIGTEAKLKRRLGNGESS